MVKFFLISGLLMVIRISTTEALYDEDCGPYGFTCERNNRVRICDGPNLVGPSFICPLGTLCNEESTDVCEDATTYLDPILTRRLRCRRNERIANPYVPGCKAYILCVPNGNRFQPIKFNCSGNTIFNGLSRTCTSPQTYKCPMSNTTKTTQELYSDNRKVPNLSHDNPYLHADNSIVRRPPTIECKNYKFSLTDDEAGKVTYFCPPRPVKGESSIRCTIFSNKFCVTLERDENDQFISDNGAPSRRPRM